MRIVNNMVTPTRPPLRYHGSKWKLASWVVRHFPPHRVYLEPFGGGASILLNKPRSELETYNDLDDQVVNFFRVLRERPAELVRALELTPWSRAEYELSHDPTEDALEAARRFFVRSSVRGSPSVAQPPSGTPAGVTRSSAAPGTTPPTCGASSTTSTRLQNGCGVSRSSAGMLLI